MRLISPQSSFPFSFLLKICVIPREVKMNKYYQTYKNLFIIVSFAFLYFPPIEKIFFKKWILYFFKFNAILPFIFLPAFCLSSIVVIIFDEYEFVKVFYSSLLTSISFYSFFTACSFYYHRSNIVTLFEFWDVLLNIDFYSEEREVSLDLFGEFSYN